MALLNRQSLCQTVDRVNGAYFWGESPGVTERDATAAWIASRIGQKGSYSGLPAPTARDFTEGIRLFTGETIRTRAGTAHILGEEACRALCLLAPRQKKIRDALGRAGEVMTKSMTHSLTIPRKHTWPGEYCCGRCSVSVWRHVLAGGLPGVNREKLFAAAVKAVHANRDGKGKWKRYPLFYTLSALVEIHTPASRAEMRYVAAKLEQYLKRKTDDRDKYTPRKRLLAERVLGQC